VIGCAQVIVAHVELTDDIDVGELICLLFERIDGDLDVDRISCGVTSGLNATWFRFQGEMK
jgi:hypothetical protein